MPGNSNLTVSVSADVTDLQTKLAHAQSAFTANSAELRKLANEFRKAGDDAKSVLLPTMQAVAREAAASKIQLNQLSAEFSAAIRPINDNAAAHKNVGGIIGQNRVAFNELGHSVRAVADGFAAGINPIQLFSEEFFRVTQAITEFNTISVGQIASWGAIAAGILGAAGALAYWGEQLALRRNDANNLAAILNAQNVTIPQGNIADVETHLRDYGNVSQDVASKVATTFGQMRGATVESIIAMSDIVPYFAKRLQIDVPEAAKKMAEVLGDVRGEGAKFLASMNASADVQNKFQAALSRTDGSAYKVVLQEITRQTIAYAEARKAALAAEIGPSAPASVSPSNRAARGNETAFLQGQQTAQINKMIADLQAAFAKLNSLPNTVGLEQFREQIERVSAAIGGNETASQKDAVAYRMWTAAVNSGKLVGDELTQAVKAQAAARTAVIQNESSEELELVMTRAKEAAAAAGANRVQELAAQKAVLTAGLNDEKLTADAKLELRKQLAQLELRDVRAQGAEVKKTAEEAYQEYVAGINEKLDAEKGAFLQQIQTINQWAAHAAEVYGTDSKQYEAAVRRKIDVDNEWAKAVQVGLEHAAQAQKNYAEGTANLAKIGERPDVGEFKSNIGLIFNSADLQSKVAAEVAKLKAALQSDLAGISADITVKLQAGDKVGASADYKTATQDILAYTQQVQKLNEQAAQAVQEAWQKITAPVGQAFDRILDAALTSHGKIGLEIDKALEGVVMDYAKMELKSVAHWVAMELAQTMATTTGVATRTAAQAAGAIAGKEAQAATAGPSIMADAAKAAAGAYAALAGIPIVGPVLAPAAAGVAFAAVAGYESLASAEGGWDRVPFDGAPAVLHKNEMVLPASIAEGVRQMTSRGVSLPRTASLGGLRSTVNNSGDTNHAMTLNHTQVINNNGGGDDYSDQRRAMRAANAHLYGTMREWFGKGSMKLPGR